MRTREQKDVRRMVLGCVILAMGLFQLAGPIPIQGQEVKFPSKPIEVIVPYVTGGFIDVGTRIFAESLSRELKVPVVIRNQPGGETHLMFISIIRDTKIETKMIPYVGTAQLIPALLGGHVDFGKFSPGLLKRPA